MEFIRTQQLDVPQQEAIHRLRHALKQQGFDRIAEIKADAGQGESKQDRAHVLVAAYNSQLASRVVAVVPEAMLLLAATFLAQPKGTGSQISVLDPQVLSIVPERQELQSLITEVRSRIEKVLEEVTNPQQATAPGASAEQVEQRLYGLILEAVETVSKKELAESVDKIFVLAKAYTAVASLKRTDEIELHLA